MPSAPRRWRGHVAGRASPSTLARRRQRDPTSTSSSSRRPTTRWRRSRSPRSKAGKHVLVEKPAARTVAELEPLIAAARRRGPPGARRLQPPLSSGAAEGARARRRRRARPAMFIRGRYGHGGRVGYDREWRADPALSGGGELIDQGVHLIDLARWFLGDFVDVDGVAHTYFWDMPVDDNAFLLLTTPAGRPRCCTSAAPSGRTCSRSRSTAATASSHIDGLGGSYGVERLAHYKMLPEMGPPETTIWEYPRATDRGRSSSPSSSRTSASSAPAAGLEAAAPRSWSSRPSTPAASRGAGDSCGRLRAGLAALPRRNPRRGYRRRACGRSPSTIPKALIPIDGRPFVEYQSSWLAGHSMTPTLSYARRLPRR